jgi:hypothetical protein
MSRQDRTELISQISENTLKSRLGEWARNIVANEDRIKAGKGVVKLFDKAKSLPVVIVAAGPSLDKNVGLLTQVKNKALIIAVDSAVVPILNIGVIPDVIVIADSKERVSGFFDNIEKDKLKGVITLVDSYVHPKTIDRIEELGLDVFWYNVFPSEKSMFCQIVPDQFTGPKGFLGSGGCVTSIAFAFATGGLKADPIILIGKDSGYYNPAQHHASGTLEKAEKFPFQEKIEEDINCNPIITNSSLQTYAYWLEDMVVGNQANGIFINATEGGIVSRGWNIIPLKIVIDRYLQKTYDFKKLLSIEEENEKVDSGTNSDKKKQKAKEQKPEEDRKPVSGRVTFSSGKKEQT